MGDILKICRQMISKETFEKVLGELFQCMKSGHDLTTKSNAIIFIQDLILENRAEEVISPQNAKKIAHKMIEFYQIATVTSALNTKESFQTLCAGCLGLQMK